GPRHRDRRDRDREVPDVPGARRRDHVHQPRRRVADRFADAGGPSETATTTTKTTQEERRRRPGAVSAVATTPAVRTRRTRTRTGLTATIVAVIASVLAYALQGLGLDGTVPAGTVAYGIVFAVLALGGWY